MKRLNADQVMREIVLAFNELDNNRSSPQEMRNRGEAHKEYLLSNGLATRDQMDRCAKQLVVYYTEHGCVPPYTREMS